MSRSFDCAALAQDDRLRGIAKKTSHNYCPKLGTTIFSCNFVELSRFTKRAEECKSYREQLFYWFRHSGQLDNIPEFVDRSSRVIDLANACEKGSFTPEKKLEYNQLMLNELDKLNAVNHARKEGEKKGRAEGRNEGIEVGEKKKTLELAKAMKKKCLSDDDIAEITGLTSEEIDSL